ncbi:hypothetical protein [Sphingomonas morindae]|uniref:Uncharacterized protein n=1 Tax=Sphingomonas morindae TaxID=1541170 RepID=A0ABY4X8T8_9SPHN|nr:hypothetical protein [Sphingomonas morindae]USI73293.1 hypothetical protein LHA26_02085 [Sphingomonas morindae]
MMASTDWTYMGEESRRGGSEPSHVVETPPPNLGIRNALRGAFRCSAADLPEEFRRLLARLR